MYYKATNSKNLKIGNVVRHERGWIGKVRAVEYLVSEPNIDECEVDWWGKEAKLAASRTTIGYLTVVENVT